MSVFPAIPRLPGRLCVRARCAHQQVTINHHHQRLLDTGTHSALPTILTLFVAACTPRYLLTINRTKIRRRLIYSWYSQLRACVHRIVSPIRDVEQVLLFYSCHAHAHTITTLVVPLYYVSLFYCASSFR